jgi:hypothetical protein
MLSNTAMRQKRQEPGTVAQILGDRPFTDPVDLSRESIESVDDALDASCIGVLVLQHYDVPDTHLAALAHARGSSGMTVKAGCFQRDPNETNV